MEVVFMFYLCLAFSLTWLISFVYIFALHRQTRNLSKRLDARIAASQHD